MKKKDNEEFLIHLWEGIALVVAIILVFYMVHRSDVKKKEGVPFRYSVHLLEKQQGGSKTGKGF